MFGGDSLWDEARAHPTPRPAYIAGVSVGVLSFSAMATLGIRNREDRLRLARFTDSYNAEVYVNPDLVTFIRQFSNDMTTINFAEEHTVTVKMQVAAVASALFSAGKP